MEYPARGAQRGGLRFVLQSPGPELAEAMIDYLRTLSAATAIGDELDALGESVKNIYAQGLGDDFADVADGLAATQQASDLFQFTPLREGRPVALLYIVDFIQVSIHAPARGATFV